MVSAIIFVRKMFRPSIMASSTPPTAADRLAARQPPRAASTPPVAAPEMMEFQGSSFFLIATSVQSNEEKSPPQTAKFPADTRRPRLSELGRLSGLVRVGATAQQAQSVSAAQGARRTAHDGSPGFDSRDAAQQPLASR